jgi:hypothetical protein
MLPKPLPVSFSGYCPFFAGQDPNKALPFFLNLVLFFLPKPPE